MRRLLRSVGFVALLGGIFLVGHLLGSRSQGGSSVPRAQEEKSSGQVTPQPSGKWYSARSAGGEETLGEEESRLLAVPYLQGYRAARGSKGITTYRPGEAYTGFNLYISGHAAEATLIDMDGRVVHRWQKSLGEVWPDLAHREDLKPLDYWRRVALLDNGDLLAIFEGLGLIRLNRDSQLLWQRRGGFHHDLQVLDDGTIYTLDRDGKVIPRLHPDKGVLEDFVTLLTSDGQPIRRISLLRAVENSPYAPLLHRIPKAGDIFHTNTLEVLGAGGPLPIFAEGRLLISILTLDTIAVVDPVEERVIWALTGMQRKQHQPTLLDNGHLLLFDNLGGGPRASRILEIDPQDQQVVWSYGGESTDFFSKTLGSVQRLPNGNTLITESENGRAFEILPTGEVVWEMHNPHRAGEERELVAALFEVIRLALDHPFPASLEALN